MATNPDFKLSLLAFPQRFDGAGVRLRLLVMPQGDPLAPLLTGLGSVPDSPAFADAAPKLVAQLIPSLAALPDPADATAQVPLATTAPAGIRPLFGQLAAQFNIGADPPGATPRRTGYSISKYLPDSYRSAFNFDRPSTPFAVTDNSYHCLLENLPGTTGQPPPSSTVSWGRVIGFAIRQPLLAAALGLLYETSVPLPDPAFFTSGGWLYVTLDPASDFAPQVAADPALLQCYAARIPALVAPRPLFAAVLFPVLPAPPAGSYDAVTAEAEDYDDGFAKIVHGSQPHSADLLATAPTGLPVSADFGLRLGWDDEQVTTWFNRQIDATQIDAPFGTAGYRVDVREHGNTAWHSLCQVTGTLALGATALGRFDGELCVETVPAQLDPTQPGQWWLPSYFGQWRGTSVVLPDPVALELHGDPNPAAGQPYTAVGEGDVPLRYGHSYDFRVRLADLSRGGPQVTDQEANPGPAPVGTVPFRRLVPFGAVTVTHLDPGATPAAPQTSYQIARPLLAYPAAVFAGIPNAVAALLADLPAAAAAGREAGLPDPDAVQLAIDVQVRQLAGDAAILAGSDPAPYSLMYSTTRAFPADPAQPLELDIQFQDVPDLAAFPVQPDSGPLVLPRARDVRLILRAGASADPQLLYWGSAQAMTGQMVELLTGAYGSDERGIFAADIAADQIRGIFLQRDPVPTSNVIAQLALAGQGGTATSDLATRLAQALSLNVSALTYSGQPGQRVVFGCSPALRATLSPEHGAITFAAKTELTQHWIIAVTLRLARDWSWGSLGSTSFEVRNGAGQVVGSIDLTSSVGISALDGPDRSGTTLVFFDAVDPKPAGRRVPRRAEPELHGHALLRRAPRAAGPAAGTAAAPADRRAPGADPAAGLGGHCPVAVHAGGRLLLHHAAPAGAVARVRRAARRSRRRLLRAGPRLRARPDAHRRAVRRAGRGQPAPGAAAGHRSRTDPHDRARAVRRPRRPVRDAAAPAVRLAGPLHAPAAGRPGRGRTGAVRLLRVRVPGRSSGQLVHRPGPLRAAAARGRGAASRAAAARPGRQPARDGRRQRPLRHAGLRRAQPAPGRAADRAVGPAVRAGDPGRPGQPAQRAAGPDPPDPAGTARTAPAAARRGRRPVDTEADRRHPGRAGPARRHAAECHHGGDAR